jgi:stearoyl-CoA desaturase (delta-9 desaturase)
LAEVDQVPSGTVATAGRTATDDAPGRMADDIQPAGQRTKSTGHGDRWSGGLDWTAVVWIALIHVGALAAPLVFTWKGVVLTLVMGWISGGLGICVGYHRLLTHGSFATYLWVRRFFAWLGALAGEGPPITWVAMHRKHHQYSDRENDPHSPRDGAWWSHMLWIFPRLRQPRWRELANRYAPDLLKDWFMWFLHWSFFFWHMAVGAALLAAGWAFWDLRTGVSFVVYGMFVRLVYVLHVTWLVNSASHIWGYRNYETRDNSRNLWWVGLLAYGEGWHNNHHAFQRSARHGHRWWELDLTYVVIRAMQAIGLAWDVVLFRPD